MLGFKAIFPTGSTKSLAFFSVQRCTSITEVRVRIPASLKVFRLSFRNCVLSCISSLYIFPYPAVEIYEIHIFISYFQTKHHHYHYYYCPYTWSYENQVSKHLVIFLNFPCLKFVYCVVCLCRFCFELVL